MQGGGMSSTPHHCTGYMGGMNHSMVLFIAAWPPCMTSIHMHAITHSACMMSPRLFSMAWPPHVCAAWGPHPLLYLQPLPRARLSPWAWVQLQLLMTRQGWLVHLHAHTGTQRGCERPRLTTSRFDSCLVIAASLQHSSA